MRKIYERVRQPTLEELDQAITQAHASMVEYRANDETVLADQCERAMNRYLDNRTQRQAADCSTTER